MPTPATYTRLASLLWPLDRDVAILLQDQLPARCPGASMGGLFRLLLVYAGFFNRARLYSAFWLWAQRGIKDPAHIDIICGRTSVPAPEDAIYHRGQKR